MSGLFAGLQRARRALGHRAGVMMQQRASYIYCKPPQDNIGIVESTFVLTVLSMAVLGPSGWILAHVEEYKSRD